MSAAAATATERRLRTLSLFALLLIWQLASLGLQADTLPSPVTVLTRLVTETLQGELLYHLAATLARVAASFLVAMAVGTALGVLMGRHGMTNAALDGLLVLGLNVPALVTIILCYIWVGLNDVAAILAVALNKIPTVAVTMREGARAVDKRLLEVARVFHLGRLRTLRRVYLPQLYPYLMAAVRSGLALIWKIVLVVELLGRSNGVGFQLGTLFQFFDIAGILAYTIAFAAVVFLVEALILRPLDHRLARWRP